MKFSSFALAALPLASAAVIDLAAADSPGPPQIRANAQRKNFKFGPYTLKPRSSAPATGGGMGGMASMGGGETQTVSAMPSGSQFCGDCTVLSGQIYLKYMDGSIANASTGVFVHHILTTGLKSAPSFVRSCSNLAGGSGFVGNGDDNSNEPVLYQSKDGSLSTGFWVSPTDKFMAQFVLVNYNPTPAKVEIYYDLEYLPGHVGKNVISSLISASCAGIKTSKTSAVNTTSSAMTFTSAGHIVLARAHLHDGGVAMHLKVNRKEGGTYTCTSKAIYSKALGTSGQAGSGHGGGAETISNVENCNPHPIKVAVGDSMIMTSEYNLAAHPLRDTGGHGTDMVMGMFRIIFAPS